MEYSTAQRLIQLSRNQKEQIFFPLLDYIFLKKPNNQHKWKKWQIQPIDGGFNNILYRATSAEGEIAIKITKRDSRDRVGREYNSLEMLYRTGLQIAPIPILLERDRYTNPVVILSWHTGPVSAEIPKNAAEWQCLIQHYVTIHTFVPDKTTAQLPQAALTPTNPQHIIDRIKEEFFHIPLDARSSKLKSVLNQTKQMSFPRWSKPQLTLSRCDPNILNFIRRPKTWVSVDWENRGWGNPFFEIGDLMAHPAYLGVSSKCWNQVIRSYCSQRNDEEAPFRIGTYYRLMLVWWATFFARVQYEISIGLKRQRFVNRPVEWWNSIPIKYEKYLNLAESALLNSSRELV
ncbi:MAG: hypothetical protein ACFFBD_03480 [Candidatus Hodarchaeota archaeon]